MDNFFRCRRNHPLGVKHGQHGEDDDQRHDPGHRHFRLGQGSHQGDQGQAPGKEKRAFNDGVGDKDIAQPAPADQVKTL